MKYKLLRFSLLSLLVMLCGGMAMAEDSYTITFKEGSGTTSDSGTKVNSIADIIADGADYVSEITTATNVYNARIGRGLKLGTGKAIGQLTFSLAEPVKPTKIVVKARYYNDTEKSITINGTAYSLSDGAGEDITIDYDGNTEVSEIDIKTSSSAYRAYVISLTIYPASSVPDTRTATKVTITEPAQEGTVGESLAYPTVTVTEAESGAVISGATVVWESSDPKVASIDRDRGYISLLAAGTTTISATYEGDETYKGSEASYKLNVYDAPIASLKALQEAATATETPVNIKFTDVQVVYVNGSNAYLADADGYGALVYTKEHGLEVGQVLNGTMSAKLMLYQGNTEITNFSKDGLTITTAAVNPVVMTKVTEANQSTLVTLKGVTYNATDKTLSDGENTITYFDKFKTSATLEDGKKYDVTGIVVIFASKDETKIEICPRTAADVADAVVEVIPPLYVIGIKNNKSAATWDMTNMDEVPFNDKTNAYELAFGNAGDIYFSFATKQMEEVDWETFNSTYRLGIGTGGNTEATLDEPMALSIGEKTIMITGNAGMFKASVSKDMATVTITRTGDYVPSYESVIIAGDAAFLGSYWDATDEDNKMEKLDDGTYKKVYKNVTVEAGKIEYKLVLDGSWIAGDNLTYTFEKAGNYNVTFTFNPATDKIDCTAEAVIIADPYEYTFESAVFKAGLVQELNGVQWTFASEDETVNLDNYNATKGQQCGTSKAPLSAFSLSTSGISGTVNKVVINTSGAASINATVKVTVGDAIFTYEGEGTAKLTDTATEYVFEGSSAGDITISYTNNSAKAIYIKSIQVNPADAPETYDITLAKDMISFSCGKDLDFSEVEGLTAYIVVGGTANTAKLQEVAQVPAGEGAILQGKAGETYQVPVINIAEMPAFNFLYPTWSSDNSSTTVAAKSTYVLSDGTFKLFTGTEIESGKAYLNKDEVGSKTWLAGGEDATAAARTLDIEGDATGIDSVTREALSNGKIYNLQGQEVKNAQKGLFIVNGKKVLVP